jgi:hypothetical protein
VFMAIRSESMEKSTPRKPTAITTIEPHGSKTTAPRDHAIKVRLDLNAIDLNHADKTYVKDVARKALAGFPTANNDSDGRSFNEISRKSGQEGAVAVEGSVVCAGRPTEASIQELRAALREEGYRVSVRERRECSELGCASDVMVDWGRPSFVPAGWYSSLICGKHDYKTCSKCRSVYVMSSTNAAGQAPALRCEVCGAIMIEWGATKIWIAELVARGDSSN